MVPLQTSKTQPLVPSFLPPRTLPQRMFLGLTLTPTTMRPPSGIQNFTLLLVKPYKPWKMLVQDIPR